MRSLITLNMLAFFATVASAGEAPTFPYKDDPAIVRTLAGLGENTARFLPRPTAWQGKTNMSAHKKWPRYQPIHRDYSNKMPYMPDRKTGFYCGGGHAHRRYNDAWEYHLGSNTWFRLVPPVGGDQGKHKGAWFVCGRISRNPKTTLNEKEKKQLDALRVWWKKYMVVEDGYLQTRGGGGFMTSHTWDGITYDPVAKKLLWAAGGHKGNDVNCHVILSDDFSPETYPAKLAAFRKTLKPVTSNMWMFDFAKNRWVRSFHDGPYVPTASGGAFMQYIPEIKKSLYYHAHGRSPMMQSYDSAANKWQAVAPNGGRSIGALVKAKLAPKQEQQVAYSAKHKVLVAVVEKDTFTYDVLKDVWARVDAPRDLVAHDAKTIFDYDRANDVFTLIQAGRKKGQGAAWAFSLPEKKWEPLKPKGGLPYAKWDPGAGFYHPEHNVFVVCLGNRVWVYRYGKVAQEPGA